ncbi:MAG: hypothetical protein ACOCWG_00115 [bacterium]
MQYPKSYSLLLSSLEKFIKKYYFNQIIRGSLLFVIFFIIIFLVISLLESFGYFDSQTRKTLFILFASANVIFFTVYILKPLLGIINIYRGMTLIDAAKLIGEYFPDKVKDKITNTLELNEFLKGKDENKELLIAGIEQKSRELTVIPFHNAIKFSSNYKYFPITLFLIIIFLAGFFIFPSFVREPGFRIINYKKEYSVPIPFDIEFNNELPLTGFQNRTFIIDFNIKGDAIPSEVTIRNKGEIRQVNKVSNNRFQYEIRSLNQNFTFDIIAGKYNLGSYTVEMLKPAMIENFSLNFYYPEYTGKKNEKIMNVGDIVIPEGTQVQWELITVNSDSVVFSHKDLATMNRSDRNPDIFTFKDQFFESGEYAFISNNSENHTKDSISYFMQVIPDQYPEISIEEFRDSVFHQGVFINGLIRDDYGFTDLYFHYKKSKSDESKNNDTLYETVPIDLDKDITRQNFNYFIDLKFFEIDAGDQFEYYFEVVDNDEINGYKSTLTQKYQLYVPDEEEIKTNTLQAEENVSSGIKNNMDELDDIQTQIDQLRNEMVNSESVSWEQRESLKELLNKQKEIQDEFEDIQKEKNSAEELKNQFSSPREEIVEKQEQLDKLFDEVMTDELKDLYEKIQNELEEMDKSEFFETLDQMQFEMEDFEDRLDRALELFKQLQVERMLTESIDELNEIKEKQDDNIKKTSDKDTDSDDDLTENQEDIKEDFDELIDQLNDLDNKNNDLSRPNNFEDTSEQQSEVMDNIEEALEQLKQQNENKSLTPQNNSSQGMEKLSEKLQNNLSAMQQENLAEDAAKLREILDNLLYSSFSQEDLMNEIAKISLRDPQYVDRIQDQRKIAEDLIIVEDSLQALAKRQIQIQSVVSKEIKEINYNIDNAIEHLANRRKHNAASRQQFVMMHINNLALLLNESLQNMEMQMQAQGQGQSSQNQQQQQGFQDLRQMQEQMNEMLEQLRQDHQQEKGESGKPRNGMGMSEQLARMAAEQEKIREKLNELADELREDGSGTGNLEDIMRDMEKNELDIVSNRINRQTQLRQQKILTRLLEHERAELEREKEETRVGETAKFYDLSNPEEFLKYNRDKSRALEMLRSSPPQLTNYYKSLVENYFLNVD